MANTIAFMDQLQGASYQSLSSTNFKLGIVDPDSSSLTTSQIASLETSGKTLMAYLSIGEAENFRSYWQSSWNSNPPSFLMGQDPNWSGDYYVKYWDPAWQQTMINQAVNLAKSGYNGVMLDMVDAYTVSSVAAADGGIANARADMMKFVTAISAATKAVNPNFKIIQNNALDLLTVNPDDPASATNTAYMSHIDGVVAEETFFSNNAPASWSSWNVQYLEHVVAAGKTVLAIDYPSSAAQQQSFVSQAIAAGFVPYAADLNLDTNMPAIDAQVAGLLPAGAMSSLLGAAAPPSGGTPTPLPPPPPPPAYHVVNVLNGAQTLSAGALNAEFVFGSGHTGNVTINNFATGSGDVVDIASSIFSSAAQALSHVTYSGNNAIVDMGSHGAITLTGVGANSLIAGDFVIGGPANSLVSPPPVTIPTPPPPPPAPPPLLTPPPVTTTPLTGYHAVNVANGTHTLNADWFNTEFMFGSGYNGHATIKYFGTDVGDVLDIAPSIFSSVADALNHVTYSGRDAIVNMGSHGTIKLVWAESNSLTAADFHIG
jgi:cysteinyl-tRNA synthetase